MDPYRNSTKVSEPTRRRSLAPIAKRIGSIVALFVPSITLFVVHPPVLALWMGVYVMVCLLGGPIASIELGRFSEHKFSRIKVSLITAWWFVVIPYVLARACVHLVRRFGFWIITGKDLP